MRGGLISVSYSFFCLSLSIKFNYNYQEILKDFCSIFQSCCQAIQPYFAASILLQSTAFFQIFLASASLKSYWNLVGACLFQYEASLNLSVCCIISYSLLRLITGNSVSALLRQSIMSMALLTRSRLGWSAGNSNALLTNWLQLYFQSNSLTLSCHSINFSFKST